MNIRNYKPLLALLLAVVVFPTCSTLADQIGVWNFNNNLNNDQPGGAAMAAVGGWSPTYVSQTIGGSPGTALSFPAFSTTQALDMPNEAGVNGPNGAGSAPSRNNWSIVMDVKFPAVGDFTSLWETGALGGNDGDYFVRAFDGIGIANQYAGAYTPSVWNRLAVTVDSAVVPGAYTVTGYINGVLAGAVTTDVSPAGREAITDFLHLFADNDNETSAGFVNSVAYYGDVLSAGAIGTLGGASAAGVPAAVNQVGLWNFNSNLTNSVAGGTAMSAVGGWSPSYVSETIGGSPATVLSFPAMTSTQALNMPNQATPDYFAVPGAPPTKTNVWSIVMDVKFPVINGFTALWNAQTLGTTDADYFIRGDFDGIGTSAQYGGIFISDTWTRIAVTVDGSVAGAYQLTGYIDGIPTGTVSFTSTSPDGKEAVEAFLHMFNDGDGDLEVSAGLVNSVAYYDELLTPEAILALGGASAAGVPVVAPPGVPGDFDGDGDVDGRDFLAWQRGASPNGTPGGPVSAADLATWQGAYNGGALSAVTVPEPSTALLLVLGFLGAGRRSRRS